MHRFRACYLDQKPGGCRHDVGRSTLLSLNLVMLILCLVVILNPGAPSLIATYTWGGSWFLFWQKGLMVNLPLGILVVLSRQVACRIHVDITAPLSEDRAAVLAGHRDFFLESITVAMRADFTQPSMLAGSADRVRMRVR